MGGVVSEAIEGVGLFLCVGGADFCEWRIGTAEALRVRAGWAMGGLRGGGKCLEAFV